MREEFKIKMFSFVEERGYKWEFIGESKE